MEKLTKNLLWIDCVGGLAAGLAVLALSGWVSRLYGLPQSVVLFICGANLAYGSFSLTLALRLLPRSEGFIKFLAGANMFWPLVCAFLTATNFGTASIFGLGHLIGEAFYVGGLGWVEWKYRRLLID